jgi:hypothetical protein
VLQLILQTGVVAVSTSVVRSLTLSKTLPPYAALLPILFAAWVTFQQEVHTKVTALGKAVWNTCVEAAEQGKLQVTSPTHQKQGLCLPEPMLLRA